MPMASRPSRTTCRCRSFCSASAARSSAAVLMWPRFSAHIAALRPHASKMSTAAPSERRRRTIGVWPPIAAIIRRCARSSSRARSRRRDAAGAERPRCHPRTRRASGRDPGWFAESSTPSPGLSLNWYTCAHT